MNAEPPGGGDADRFLAELRADEAAAARRRERWLRRSFAEAATVAGILAGARGRTVTLLLRTGDRVAGEVLDAGAEVVRLRPSGGVPTWVVAAAVAAVETEEPLPADEPPSDGPTLAEVLTELTAEGAAVRVRLAAGPELRGEVLAVGEVLTLRDGPTGPLRYVPLGELVWVLPSS
ncbi:MAG: hypothetical protein ACOYOP_11795 [Microthrixaceae bacterium]